MCRKQAVNDRVGSAVEWYQTLDEGRDGDVGLRFGNVSVHLQQVEHDVRTPAEDEDYKKEKSGQYR